MAIVGCSYLKYGIYSESQGVVSYSNGGTAAKLTSLDISLDSATDNDFYADNGIDESDSQFGGGTVTVNTNDLTDAVSKALLGLQDAALETITGITDTGVKEILYDDRQVTPFLGIGMVIKHIRGGTPYYTGVVLTKVMFKIPNDAAETQGKTISWQTPELVGTIFRDDSTYHGWKKMATFTTESQAVIYINSRLNIT